MGQGNSASHIDQSRTVELTRADTHLKIAIDALVKAELPLASAYADFALSICARALGRDLPNG